MIVAFEAGSMTVEYAGLEARAFRPADRRPAVFPTLLYTRLLRALLVFTAINAVGVISLARAGLSRFGLGLSLLALAQVGTRFSLARYGGQGDLPRLVLLGIYCGFPAAIAGGVIAATAKRRWHFWVTPVPLVLALANALLITARAGLIASFLLWLGGFIATKTFLSGGRYRLVRSSWVLGIGVLSGVLIGMYGLVQWVRTGVENAFELTYLGLHVMATWFGSIAAWTHWVCNAGSSSGTLGAITFGGPYELLGLAQRTQGTYEEAVYFPSGDFTNIYTAFRGLIEDFGLIPTWLILFACGMLATWAYRRCARGDIKWCVVMAVFYTMTLFSHLYSLFSITSVTFAWLIVLGLWLWPPFERAPARDVQPLAESSG